MERFQEQQHQTGEVSLASDLGPGSGPPLLCLHGVARRGSDFGPLLPFLPSGWRLLTLDLRGHGRSGHAASGYRVVDYVRDVLWFLREACDAPVLLCGHSLGAMVACAAAALAPERVRGVILEDPPFETLGARIRETPFHAQFVGMREAARRKDLPAEAIARELAEVRIPLPTGGSVRMGDLRSPEQLRWSAECLLRMDPQVLTPLIEGEWLRGYEMETLLPEVRCPALLLAGDAGAGGMLAPADAQRVASLLPRCARVDFPGVGHLIHGTRPAAMGEAIGAFLHPF